MRCIQCGRFFSQKSYTIHERLAELYTSAHMLYATTYVYFLRAYSERSVSESTDVYYIRNHVFQRERERERESFELISCCCCDIHNSIHIFEVIFEVERARELRNRKIEKT